MLFNIYTQFLAYQCGCSIVTKANCPDIAGAAEIGTVILWPQLFTFGDRIVMVVENKNQLFNQETVACLLIEIFVFQAVFFIFTLMLLSFYSLIRLREQKYLVNFKKIWF